KTDVENSKDYPLIGRFEGAVIEFYKETKWGTYKIPVDENGKINFDKPKILEGKVIRIQYSISVDDNPAYLLQNYKAAFTKAGFTILTAVADEGVGVGTRSQDWDSRYYGPGDAYFSNALNNGKFGGAIAIPAWKSNQAFIVANIQKDGKDIYISMYCVENNTFTLINQDVIEVETAQVGDMIKVNAGEVKTDDFRKDPTVKTAKEGVIDAQKTDAAQSDQSILKSKNVKSFDLRIGFGGFSFSAPWLAGSCNFFNYNPTGTVTGSITGFGLLNGPYANVRYFFNENFGLSLDVNSLKADEDVFTTNINYTSTASLFSQKVGLTGQFVGDNTPVRLSTTLGVGHCLTELHQSTVMVPPYAGTDVYLTGKASMLVMFLNVDVSFPIYRKLYLFGNYEFNFTPVGSFIMEHDGGNDYSNTYNNTDFGGSHFRFGLSYSF
ncbi:MAG: hypothetical protein NTW82_12790, partial [Bacteroidia bacterium]|nr:hypothetical protein [Bacteroidia bacterium]